MLSAQVRTTPYWFATARPPLFPPLTEDLTTDVVIVGGGITGLTAAYILSRAGRRVVLLERDRCASADTGHTSAHLTMVTDLRLTDLATAFGREAAALVWEGGRAAITQIEWMVRAHDIQADFARIDGYLHAPTSADRDVVDSGLEKEAALAIELGFEAEYLMSTPFMHRPGVHVPRQARINPRKYLCRLAEIVAQSGVRIFEHSEADEFLDEPRGVKAHGRTVTCQDVIIATHNPLVGLRSTTGASLFQTKLALYTSYVVSGRVAPGTAPDALWWDTADPYLYVRVDPRDDHDEVIVGGEDHKTGQHDDTGAAFARLERRARELVPGLTLTHRWSGQVIETADGLPYIGRTADHQYAATGYAGNGLTFGTLAAMMMTDAILERPNRWAELFDPMRKVAAGSLWDYVKENVDYPLRLVRDRLTRADDSLNDLPAGEGRVVDRDGSKVAAFRAADGTLTLRSAICPHLGCVVQWNGAERTWDCPCHGSRFRATGEVISGPAEASLSTDIG